MSAGGNKTPLRNLLASDHGKLVNIAVDVPVIAIKNRFTTVGYNFDYEQS